LGDEGGAGEHGGGQDGEDAEVVAGAAHGFDPPG
jgi:hypothetical protein